MVFKTSETKHSFLPLFKNVKGNLCLPFPGKSTNLTQENVEYSLKYIAEFAWQACLIPRKQRQRENWRSKVVMQKLTVTFLGGVSDLGKSVLGFSHYTEIKDEASGVPLANESFL